MKKGTKVIRPLNKKELSPLPTGIPVNPTESRTINILKRMPMCPESFKSKKT